MNRNARSVASTVALCAALIAGISSPAGASTWCVNPGGTGGCFAKIGMAVSTAAINDTINVASGTYKEDVIIGKALSLVGENRENTIIDATGLANGIYIDGLDHPGLSNVVVTGFTVENANFEGILVTNASFVTITGNEVTNNDRSLNVTTLVCATQPAFETAESEDCGEGIHLIAVDHSILANNSSENNAGGILLSDETGETHDNVITGNTVRNNPFDCGITLASHPPYSTRTTLGIIHNTIANNESLHNGYQVPGAGAGVGIFGFLPGATVSGNVVINNRLMNNGLPGVAFHAHNTGAGAENLNDNVIIGNQISGNGADTGDALTPGTAGINTYGHYPILGTIISQNVIDQEAYDIVVNTDAQVDAHLNIFLGQTVGVDNLDSGTVDATENWWGCSGGPGADDCATVEGSGVLFTPWLTWPFADR